MKYDFSGYATKNNLKCSDGRVIRKDAFKHNDGQTVPLVWQHMHDDPSNVLGHALLENRDDGVYAYCIFNDSVAGKNSKTLVQHGDVTALSIFANKLQQKGSDVIHGAIKEVSLVLSGANPGALIDNLSIQHGDSIDVVDDEAIIYTGEVISTDDIEHEDKSDGKTVQDVFDTLNDEQKNVVYAMLSHALADGEDNDDEDEEVSHSDEGEESMKKNVFQKEDTKDQGQVLSHSQIETILADAQRTGSLKESFLAHAGTYGIDNIDYLFPEAKTLTNTPDLIKRDDDWVKGFLSSTKHNPFSRIKSVHADITAEEARAKGYVKGNLKKEEVFGLLKRTTTPTTVYKKQKLDRDDIIDITDLNVVQFLKSEMRIMLDEEIARAALVGDGREVDNADKINETNIRPIYKDDDLYSHKVDVGLAATTTDKIESIIRARKEYKGSGNPNFYTTTDELTDMLLLKDTTGRRIYRSIDELARELRVNKIIEVEVLEGVSRTVDADTFNLIGIIVNPKDYTFGADKGGQISMFDDFDIDYNQQKYLIETRCSGCLTKPKSAVVIEEIQPAV